MDINNKELPDVNLADTFHGFSHLTFWVENAKQSAGFYTSRFGFEYLAYKGLETGERAFSSHVVKNGDIVLEFQSALDKSDPLGIRDHLKLHGIGIRDIAFKVSNLKSIHSKAISNGAIEIQPPTLLRDLQGSVIISTIQTFGDTCHTLVENIDFTGVFLPNYKLHPQVEAFNKLLQPIKFSLIDHVACSQPIGDMKPTCEWYQKMLDFHAFWTGDEDILRSKYSSIQSTVMTDKDEVVKLNINEPADGKKVSQIQEFIDYYAGAGVQHIAFETSDIIETVRLLMGRGVEFLPIPKEYYENLERKLPNLAIEISEDIRVLQELNILIDYDDEGYLLQLFTKLLGDSPTIFIEVIYRNNYKGYGAGNFISLFKAIERQQELRGNLVDKN